MSERARSRVIPVAAALALALLSGIAAAATSWTFIAESATALLFGFVPFLGSNVPRISWNADTLVPGLLAFVAACGVGHGWLRSIAERHGRPWRVSHSLALALFLPVLFVISFLVPGVELQIRLLLETPVIAAGPGA